MIDNLPEILAQHAAWLEDKTKGARANLQGVSLRGANLRGANLRGADLYHTDLRGANLQRADLYHTDLRVANLNDADLRGADLRGANLEGADLQGADLYHTDLRGANLEGAYLQGVDLQGAYLPEFQLPDGELIVYKKLFDGIIATLQIDAGVARTASLVGKKCRAASARVINLEGHESGVSIHDANFTYQLGEVVTPYSYSDDIRIECAPGIHCFRTRDEAVAYHS